MTDHPAPEPTVRATEYVVSCLPEDHPDADIWGCRVEYRGRERWAVTRSGRRCLARDGKWSWETLPSEREDEWLEQHRFTLDEALLLAKQQAPLITSNGLNAAQVLAWSESRS